eukprot:11210947-Lingulodinium_polyedra.AAC.1
MAASHIVPGLRGALRLYGSLASLLERRNTTYRTPTVQKRASLSKRWITDTIQNGGRAAT